MGHPVTVGPSPANDFSFRRAESCFSCLRFGVFWVRFICRCLGWPTVTGCPVSNPGNNGANGLFHTLAILAFLKRFTVHFNPGKLFSVLNFHEFQGIWEHENLSLTKISRITVQVVWMRESALTRKHLSMFASVPNGRQHLFFAVDSTPLNGSSPSTAVAIKRESAGRASGLV